MTLLGHTTSAGPLFFGSPFPAPDSRNQISHASVCSSFPEAHVVGEDAAEAVRREIG